MERKNDHRELIALSLIKGIGDKWIEGLIKDESVSASDIFRMHPDHIRRCRNTTPAIAVSISSFDRWHEVDDILERTEKADAKIITISDPEYPEKLRELYCYPSVLWVKGDTDALSNPGLAIVGTRNADRYGRKQAEAWSRRAVGAGLTVVSGLAYGVDTIAHESAVKSGGITTAILGSGIDRIYPASNRGLVREIISSGGAVATEFPPGTRPFPANFPRRNRIVCGLSLGVLVIQSDVRGGSMITARIALDENREVFVIPHSLEQNRGRGNNYLIKAGQGKLVQEMEDVLDEILFQPVSHPAGYGKDVHTWRERSLTQEQKEICRTLSRGELQIDNIAEITGRQSFELLTQLLELEMDGIIVQRAGKYFELK